MTTEVEEMTARFYDYIVRIDDRCKEFFASPKGPETLLQFTHVADADGIGCEALTYAFLENRYSNDHLKVVRCSYNNLPKIVEEECEKQIAERNQFRVLLTDLNVDPKIVVYLESKDIDWFWIDHHVLPDAFHEVVKYPDDISENIMVFYEEYASNLFDEYFGSCETFNPDRYGGRVKYSAFALYYVALTMAGIIHYSDDGTSDDVERGIVENLSNSDTYLFKAEVANGSVNPYWIPSHKYFDDPESMVYIGFIVDIYPLVMKGQGADALRDMLVSAFRKMYRSFSYCSFTQSEEVHLAQMTHNSRVLEYKFFKKSIEYFEEPILGKIAFLPEPDANFSIFSTWLFDEDPELSATIGVYVNSRTVSMRSPDNGPDVRDYCTKHFNGGGHAHAAGGKISVNGYLNTLQLYYASKERTMEERETGYLRCAFDCD